MPRRNVFGAVCVVSIGAFITGPPDRPNWISPLFTFLRSVVYVTTLTVGIIPMVAVGVIVHGTVDIEPPPAPPVLTAPPPAPPVLVPDPAPPPVPLPPEPLP